MQLSFRARFAPHRHKTSWLRKRNLCRRSHSSVPRSCFDLVSLRRGCPKRIACRRYSSGQPVVGINAPNDSVAGNRPILLWGPGTYGSRIEHACLPCAAEQKQREQDKDDEYDRVRLPLATPPSLRPIIFSNRCGYAGSLSHRCSATLFQVLLAVQESLPVAFCSCGLFHPIPAP